VTLPPATGIGMFRLGWIGIVILVVLGALRLYMWSKERRS
jgi:Sec-independent protein translocase protein TatA